MAWQLVHRSETSRDLRDKSLKQADQLLPSLSSPTMLEVLTAAPVFSSPEENDRLTSSTPANFADIPPVLRFEDADAEVSLTPSTGLDGWTDGKVQGKLWVTEA